MFRFQFAFGAAVAALVWVSASAIAQDNLTPYPITLKANDVHEIAALTAQSNGLTIKGKNLLVIPIRTEPGITGAVLLGNGEFSFAPTDGDEIKGEFRAAMLRFNPADQPKLLPLDGGKVITDHAAYEMGRHLLNDIFRHCYHSGMDALIPDAGSFVANVYSTTHGDLLISTTPDTTSVYNFTTREILYPKQ